MNAIDAWAVGLRNEGVASDPVEWKREKVQEHVPAKNGPTPSETQFSIETGRLRSKLTFARWFFIQTRSVFYSDRDLA